MNVLCICLVYVVSPFDSYPKFVRKLKQFVLPKLQINQNLSFFVNNASWKEVKTNSLRDLYQCLFSVTLRTEGQQC